MAKVILLTLFCLLSCAVIALANPYCTIPGDKSLKRYRIGSRITYSCRQGYTLVGKRQLTCLLNRYSYRGYWSSPPPVCKSIRCPRLPDPRNGDVSVTRFTVGSAASYTCDKGFILIEATTRTCLPTGDWSGEAPVCRIQTTICPRLRNPRNGDVSVTGFMVGSVASYVCDNGFLLVGASTRHCLSSGDWSREAPVCRIQLTLCPRLPDPRNGDVTVTRFTVGSVASYVCDNGFLLVGASTRHCLSSGDWSGEAPVCRRQTTICPRLRNPRNGDVSVTGFTVGSVASYVCDNGFLLVGATTRHCLSSGDWSGEAPVCRSLHCPRLPDPRNGDVIVSGITVGSVASYTCDNGFLLVGATSRHCLSSGDWSGEAPVCKSLLCPQLPDPRNGDVSVSGVTIGSVASYTCDRGFLLVGASTRRCLSTGSWSGDAPVCISISCPQLSDPRYGSVSVSGLQVGSSATYKCDNGFVLVGGSSRTCLSTGQWSGQAPTCKPILCSQLSDPRYRSVSVSGLQVGSSATYECDNGFLLVGGSSRTCLSTGQWSGQAPTCKPILCSQLSDPRYGSVSVSGLQVGSSATYECENGFVLVGGSSRTCLSTGQWSGQAPTCKPVLCSQLSDPRYGSVSVSGLQVGSSATYKCDNGFLLVGGSSRTCLSTGQWSGQAPTCKPILCSQLSDPIYGSVSVSGIQVGSSATYKCDNGFVLVGGSSRTCLSTGQWSRQAPTCKPILCSQLSDPRYGSVSVSGIQVGSSATYKCDNGFLLVGGSSRTCLSTGQWSGQAPTCKPILCSQLSDPRYGSVSVSGLQVGSSATYECDNGFLLVGGSSRTCLNTGQWSGQAPTCKPVRCPNLQDPVYGDVYITGNSVGDRATYTCNRGFNLEGVENRKCQTNGQWSGDAPVCKPINCESPPKPSNGFVTYKNANIGSLAVHSCQKGYILQGHKYRVCLFSGQWSGQTPQCRPHYYY